MSNTSNLNNQNITDTVANQVNPLALLMKDVKANNNKTASLLAANTTQAILPFTKPTIGATKRKTGQRSPQNIESNPKKHQPDNNREDKKSISKNQNKEEEQVNDKVVTEDNKTESYDKTTNDKNIKDSPSVVSKNTILQELKKAENFPEDVTDADSDNVTVISNVTRVDQKKSDSNHPKK